MGELHEVDRRRSHQCAICGSAAPWSDDWQWFGSYKDEDDGRSIVKVCSDACRGDLTEADLVKIQRRLERESKRLGERVSYLPLAKKAAQP